MNALSQELQSGATTQRALEEEFCAALASRGMSLTSGEQSVSTVTAGIFFAGVSNLRVHCSDLSAHLHVQHTQEEPGSFRIRNSNVWVWLGHTVSEKGYVIKGQRFDSPETAAGAIHEVLARAAKTEAV
jgi:hypothetical protein